MLRYNRLSFTHKLALNAIIHEKGLHERFLRFYPELDGEVEVHKVLTPQEIQALLDEIQERERKGEVIG